MTLVARADESLALRLVVDRAGEMRALLAVRHVAILGQADQDADVSCRRVLEHLDPADWQLVDPRDGERRIVRRLRGQGATEDPCVAGEQATTRQHKELSELPAVDVALL